MVWVGDRQQRLDDLGGVFVVGVRRDRQRGVPRRILERWIAQRNQQADDVRRGVARGVHQGRQGRRAVRVASRSRAFRRNGGFPQNQLLGGVLKSELRAGQAVRAHCGIQQFLRG